MSGKRIRPRQQVSGRCPAGKAKRHTGRADEIEGGKPRNMKRQGRSRRHGGYPEEEDEFFSGELELEEEGEGVLPA